MSVDSNKSSPTQGPPTSTCEVAARNQLGDGALPWYGAVLPASIGRHEGALHPCADGGADLLGLRAPLALHLRHHAKDHGAAEAAR